MKMKFSSFLTLILCVVIMLAVMLPAFAVSPPTYFKGVTVGAQGLTVKGGISTIAIVPIVNEATATRTVTSADFGKIIACSYAGATTITLPDPAAGIVGATFFITELVDQALTIVGGSTANNNQIIADGVLTCDNVAFSTSSHKIGAMARVTCISATKWLITNASGCAMTVEAAD